MLVVLKTLDVYFPEEICFSCELPIGNPLQWDHLEGILFGIWLVLSSPTSHSRQ